MILADNYPDGMFAAPVSAQICKAGNTVKAAIIFGLDVKALTVKPNAGGHEYTEKPGALDPVTPIKKAANGETICPLCSPDKSGLEFMAF